MVINTCINARIGFSDPSPISKASKRTRDKTFQIEAFVLRMIQFAIMEASALQQIQNAQNRQRQDSEEYFVVWM